jgi:hypothetical protein
MTTRHKLNQNAEIFLKKAMGPDGFEELSKFELVKDSTQTVIDHEEVRTALTIVPRAVLAFLNATLKELDKGGVKEFKLPVKENAYLNVHKLDKDVYTGHIHQDGRIIARFKNRSLPGVGLIIMTTFELYDINDLKEAQNVQSPQVIDINRLIDEKIAMRDMIGKVIDKKLDERDAIERIINNKLNQMIVEAKKEEKSEQPKITEEIVQTMEKKQKQPLKLKNFLEQRNFKRKSHLVSLEKSHKIECPDCRSTLLKDFVYTGCVCFGENMGSKLTLKKNQMGFSVDFDDSWNKDNIEMLLEILRKQRGVL